MPSFLSAGTIPLAVALVAPALLSAQGGPGLPPREPPPPTIEVAGQGEVTAMPDRAQVLVSVQVRARTAAAAGTENAQRSQKVLDALRAAGVPREQLATLGYSVQPAYRYPGDGKSPELVGYDARNTVRVELRQVDQVGKVLDAALAAGANDIAGVNFHLGDPSAVKRDALAAATSDARLAAEAIARAAGGTLGALLSVTTQEGEFPRPVPMAMMARAEGAMDKAPTPIYAPTEQTVTGRVVARWLYLPAGR